MTSTTYEGNRLSQAEVEVVVEAGNLLAGLQQSENVTQLRKRLARLLYDAAPKVELKPGKLMTRTPPNWNESTWDDED